MRYDNQENFFFIFLIKLFGQSSLLGKYILYFPSLTDGKKHSLFSLLSRPKF